MEFSEVVRRRRMCRNFSAEPVDPAVLVRILDAGRRAPSAGWTQGTEYLVLEGSSETARYWDITLPEPERLEFRWPGLLDAPVLVLVFSNARAYLDRYSRPDKASSGLGESEARWPVPYWHIDAAMSAMAMLLAASNEKLGALFFGIFKSEAQLLAELSVPAGYTPIGTIAIGHPLAGRASRSLARGRRGIDEVVHRGQW